ncbi:hypothetical protein I4U23_004449 [Adineta vaga]|nr:hypothetical protein I4U23_004449 [Adineta vaga]
MKLFYILSGLFILFSIIAIALNASIIGVIINYLNSNKNIHNNESCSFVEQIKFDDLMKHLEQLQVIADRSNGTRAIGTQGFNETLDYITEQLKQNTNFFIRHEYFQLPNCIVEGTPQLQSRINGMIDNYVYLSNFTHILFSPSIHFDSFIRLVSIPNLGCRDTDWNSVSAKDSIALAALDTTMNAGVLMKVNVSHAEGIGNICADTPTGDKTKTIVVGAHSDEKWLYPQGRSNVSELANKQQQTWIYNDPDLF